MKHNNRGVYKWVTCVSRRSILSYSQSALSGHASQVTGSSREGSTL